MTVLADGNFSGANLTRLRVCIPQKRIINLVLPALKLLLRVSMIINVGFPSVVLVVTRLFLRLIVCLDFLSPSLEIFKYFLAPNFDQKSYTKQPQIEINHF